MEVLKQMLAPSHNQPLYWSPPPEFKPVQDGVIEEMTRLVNCVKNFDIIGVFAPAPVTPWFKDPSSVLYGYNEDLVLMLMCLVLLFVLDVAIVRPFLHPKARYFALHAVANAIVVVYAFPDVVAVLTEDPATVFFGPMKTIVPTSAVIGLHLYHCLAFQLTPADIFHHLYFAFLLCILAVPCKGIQGASANFGAFFLSGLPGGIDYVLLCLNYHGIVTRKQEKQWNTYINLYLRAPATVVYLVVAWTAWLNPGVTRASPPSAIFYVLAFIAPYLHFYNGQYYCRDTVESNHIFNLKLKHEKLTEQKPDESKKSK